MMQKICPQCQHEFESRYATDKYCSGDCLAAKKRDEYHLRWAASKGDAKPKASQRLKLHQAGFQSKACY